MNNIVIMGLPAAGKGTLCQRLSEQYGFEHISTGEILRSEQAKGTKLGNMATRVIDSGGYMPDDIMIPMLKERVIASDNAVGFLFDGFPCTKEQAKHLHAFLFMRKQPIASVIFLDVKKNVAVERLLKRATIENRPDDTESAIVNRWNEYEQKTLPLIDYFSKLGLIETVDANGTTDHSHAQASVIIDRILNP